jgi:large subunit GTPase 1
MLHESPGGSLLTSQATFSLVSQENVRALTKGVQAVMGYKPGSGLVTANITSAENGTGKPWKKHGNRNKKEKSRRLYKHLDM